MIIRAKSFKDWMCANYTHQELLELMQYGVAQGVRKLIYHEDTDKLYNKFCNEIWDIAQAAADNAGYDGVLSMLDRDISSDAGLKTALVWIAAEYVARQIMCGE